MQLYEKIKFIRKKKGIAQKFIAKQVGMTISSYNMKENGKRPIVTEELELISSALDVNASIFFEENFHVKWNSKSKEVS